jgi:hypothetical protein
MQIPPPDVIKQAQELIDAGKFNEALAFCESIAPLYEAQEAWEEWVQISNMQNYCLMWIGKIKRNTAKLSSNLRQGNYSFG